MQGLGRGYPRLLSKFHIQPFEQWWLLIDWKYDHPFGCYSQTWICYKLNETSATNPWRILSNIITNQLQNIIVSQVEKQVNMKSMDTNLVLWIVAVLFLGLFLFAEVSLCLFPGHAQTAWCRVQTAGCHVHFAGALFSGATLVHLIIIIMTFVSKILLKIGNGIPLPLNFE